MTKEEKKTLEEMLDELKSNKPENEKDAARIQAMISYIELMLFDIKPISKEDLLDAPYYEYGCKILAEYLQKEEGIDDFDAHKCIRPYVPVFEGTLDGNRVMDYDSRDVSFKGVYLSEWSLPEVFHCIFGYKSFPTRYPVAFGIADNATQIIEALQNPEIFEMIVDREDYIKSRNANAKFVVLMDKVSNFHTHTEGGWRWHKWGKYIGKHTPHTEYLEDDDDIDYVYTFEVFSVVEDKNIFVSYTEDDYEYIE